MPKKSCFETATVIFFFQVKLYKMDNQSKPLKQRLVIFLDGTWNTEDDGTNILQAHALTKDGLTEDGYIQKRYYDRGVGTGLMDRIVGGGFGVGLEVNVREAYCWLVDNYNDKEYYNDKTGDEIYIFGFSRGAYSARSLVGFIATCGLLRRGSPLSIGQLWSGYVQISRKRGKKINWWEKAKKLPFKRITTIDRIEHKNLTEKLIEIWSRRVEINYLGIFDTVGAMGIEALGIPGIRSRRGMNHNQNPTKLILKCQHAMAIDENRTSFRLTKLLNYVDNLKSEKDDTYNDRIFQRWFVGAHSDVGGGYNDNLLASHPLKWIMDGAIDVGLKMDNFELPSDEPKASIDQINDSYKDFTGMIWPHILREKRHYRQIDQPDIVIAGRAKKIDEDDKIKYRGGFSLVTINEEIDQSVIDLAKAAYDSYAPPNLINYARGVKTHKIKSDDSPETKADKEERNGRIEEIKKLFGNKEPQERWLGNAKTAPGILVLWSILSALGVVVFLNSFLLDFPDSTFSISCIAIAIIAFFFVVIDFAEFCLNLRLALNPSEIITKVALNLMMWIRMSGILFFFIGVISFIYQCIQWGGNRDNILDIVLKNKIYEYWYFIPLSAIITVLLLNLYNNGWKIGIKRLFSNILAPFVLIIAGGILYFIASSFIDSSVSEIVILQEEMHKAEKIAGSLIIIQLLLLIFFSTFLWVGKPTRRIRLKWAAIKLQFAFGKKRKLLFDDWRIRLTRDWIPAKKQKDLAWSRVKEVLRESLWRDNIAFVPIYTLVFGTIIWIESTFGNHEGWSWLSYYAIYTPFSDGEQLMNLSMPFWVFLIVLTALGDYIENFIHLLIIKKYPKGKVSFFYSLIAIIATSIKTVGFVLALLSALGIFTCFSIDLFSYLGKGGWRWFIAYINTLVILVLLFPMLIYMLKSLISKPD